MGASDDTKDQWLALLKGDANESDRERITTYKERKEKR